MDETKYQYELDKDGNRVMSDESQKQRILSLFRGLYPFEVDGVSMRRLGQLFVSKVNFNKPTMIVSSLDIPKSVFGSILRVLYEGKWKKFISWSSTIIDHLTDCYVNIDTDIAKEFSMYDVLFVEVNVGETKNYLHPHLIRKLSMSRKSNNKMTFFFFHGTVEQLKSKKWMIDEYNDGTELSSLSNYINIIDLNGGGTEDMINVIK